MNELMQFLDRHWPPYWVTIKVEYRSSAEDEPAQRYIAATYRRRLRFARPHLITEGGTEYKALVAMLGPRPFEKLQRKAEIAPAAVSAAIMAAYTGVLPPSYQVARKRFALIANQFESLTS